MSIRLPGNQLTGVILAVISAIFWGISGTCAQFLFEQKKMDAGWLVCWRMICAGLILLVFSSFQKNSDTLKIWKKTTSAVQLLLFSICGMMAVQYTYFYSISLSNAATATVLQYIGPVFVVAFYALKNRRWPILMEYASLALALIGTFLLVTHGSLSRLVISEKALIWGILSAITLAVYTIQPVRLASQYSPAAVSGWGMLIGGLAFLPFTSPFQLSGQWDLETGLAVGYIILFGSVLAFYFFLKAITLIGATTASLLCSIEPLAATVVAVFWLGIRFTELDWLGTFCILLTVILLTLNKNKTVISG